MMCIGRDQYTYSTKDAGQYLVFPQCGEYTETYITALSLAVLRCTIRNTGPIKSQGRIQDFFWEGVHSSLALLQHQ